MINKIEFFKLYTEIFMANHLDEFCNEEIIEKMYQMSEYMIEVNQSMNLTAITDTPGIISKHLADSVISAKYIPENARVCDVGCGGGFPSLPLAIARPDATIVGIDSTEKRINYVNESAKRLGLTHLSAITGRAEELAQDKNLRESFDICIARAVANLPVLSELCIPFVAIGGSFIAMKGKLGDDEITKASQKLGVEAISENTITRYTLITPSGNESRCIVKLNKLAITEAKYPRNYSQIKKKPL